LIYCFKIIFYVHHQQLALKDGEQRKEQKNHAKEPVMAPLPEHYFLTAEANNCAKTVKKHYHYCLNNYDSDE
jgi:hypothetical protein